MYKNNYDYDTALSESLNLFDYRVFKMIEDDLFITPYSKKIAKKLHNKAKRDVESLRKSFQ